MRRLSVMSRIGKCFLGWRRHLQRGIIARGASIKQYYLLSALASRDFLYPADIAEKLYSDRPTTTVLIQNMEKAQWLTSQRDPNDGKRRRISISPQGRAKLEELWPAFLEAGPEPDSVLTDEEKEELHALLDKLEAFIEKLA